MQTPWTYRFAQRTARMTSSTIRELLKLTERPEMISFAGGLPAPELFPLAEVQAATERIMSRQGTRALQYGPTEGYQPLRELLARRMCDNGLFVRPENLLITGGSQQALDLLGKIFINPGDRVLVESPTYLGALQAWNAYGAEYVTVPLDGEGMNTQALESALRTGPKFIYALPNFHNPAGVTMGAERRRHLVALADRYGVPIVEDDPYGQLRFSGTPLPSLAVLDGLWHTDVSRAYRGNVIYLSTFSKILAPGLRVAWVIAPTDVIEKLVQAKQGADLQTAMLNQMIAHDLLASGFIDGHIERIREVYRDRCALMLRAMEEHFPVGVTWTRPNGGLFLWVTLPPAIDAGALLPQALAEQVAFVPGVSFHATGGGANTFRLNFSNATPENIVQGIARLGRVLSAALAAPAGTPTAPPATVAKTDKVPVG